MSTDDDQDLWCHMVSPGHNEFILLAIASWSPYKDHRVAAHLCNTSLYQVMLYYKSTSAIYEPSVVNRTQSCGLFAQHLCVLNVYYLAISNKITMFWFAYFRHYIHKRPFLFIELWTDIFPLNNYKNKWLENNDLPISFRVFYYKWLQNNDLPISFRVFYWHWGDPMIAPVPVRQPWAWWLWLNKSIEFTKNGIITKPKHNASKACGSGHEGVAVLLPGFAIKW